MICLGVKSAQATFSVSFHKQAIEQFLRQEEAVQFL